MPAYHVERTILIEKPITEVNRYIANFGNWQHWSPWLIMEPSATVTLHGNQNDVGAGYHWVGKLIGEGKMTLQRLTETDLDIALEFIKPFKSHAMANFRLQADGDSTRVTWLLDASLPWFMFFLKNMLQTSLGMDYDRGLAMLKSVLETGDVPSQLELIGKENQAGRYYVGIARQAKTAELPTIIPQDFQTIADWLNSNNVESAGPPFTLYYDMDIHTTVNTLHNGIPVDSPVDVAAPLVCEQLPASPVYKIKHTGDYEFMANAWAYAMFCARNYKVKLKKKPVGYENYVSDPTTTDAKDLVTEVVLFTK